MREALFMFESGDGSIHYLFPDGEWIPELKPEDVRFANMLAAQSPPGIQTDTQFMAGMPQLGEGLPDRERAMFLKKLKKQGISTTSGTYNPTLADHFGDGNAVIDGRSDLLRKARAGNKTAVEDGKVLNQRRQPEVDPFENPVHKLSPSIVKRKMRRALAEDPKARKMDKRELKESIIDKHGPPK